MLYCEENCKYLKPTEKEQDEDYVNSMDLNPDDTPIREQHQCTLFNGVVVHGGHHPKLMSLDECEEFKRAAWSRPIDKFIEILADDQKQIERYIGERFHDIIQSVGVWKEK